MAINKELFTLRENNPLFQIFGFILIFICVCVLLLSLACFYSLDNERVAILFFLLMLGISFAFPGLLKDQNRSLSTMRLVVFMMVNVICILLLKIGWDKPDFGAIGMNSYWMGIIAFVFGAKATQSYFESKMADPAAIASAAIQQAVATVPGVIPASAQPAPDTADSIRQAIQQNQALLQQYPNIVSMLVGAMAYNGQNVFCVDIHLSDRNTAGIPTKLVYTVNQQPFTVPANVIPGLGAASSNIGKGATLNNAANGSGPGTLACFLTDANKRTFYALSCCHVFNGGQWQNYTGPVSPAGQQITDGTGAAIGPWTFALMNNDFDLALAQVTNNAIVSSAQLSAPRDVDDADIRHKTGVSFTGSVTPLGAGIISNNQCTRDVLYGKQTGSINNLILISTGAGAAPASAGDSGALVYTAAGKEPIGIIIASDAVFTYVTPITNILESTGKIIF